MAFLDDKQKMNIKRASTRNHEHAFIKNREEQMQLKYKSKIYDKMTAMEQSNMQRQRALLEHRQHYYKELKRLTKEQPYNFEKRAELTPYTRYTGAYPETAEKKRRANEAYGNYVQRVKVRHMAESSVLPIKQRKLYRRIENTGYNLDNNFQNYLVEAETAKDLDYIRGRPSQPPQPSFSIPKKSFAAPQTPKKKSLAKSQAEKQPLPVQKADLMFDRKNTIAFDKRHTKCIPFSYRPTHHQDLLNIDSGSTISQHGNQHTQRRRTSKHIDFAPPPDASPRTMRRKSIEEDTLKIGTPTGKKHSKFIAKQEEKEPFDMLQMLSTRYLRLTSKNVEQLEGSLIESGYDPGVHAHYSEARVLSSFAVPNTTRPTPIAVT